MGLRCKIFGCVYPRWDRVMFCKYCGKITELSIIPPPPKNQKAKMKDNVHHPKHYTSHPSGVECIQVTEHYDFCVGNAIKYLWRAGLKNDSDKSELQKEIEDLEKAKWYINRRITHLNKENHE